MCQKFSDKQCDSLSLSKMPGLKPGFASSDTTRDSDEELPMNGNSSSESRVVSELANPGFNPGILLRESESHCLSENF